MVEFKRVSEILGSEYPALNVCTNNGSTIKVMQWQCSGEITINANYGVKKEDELFLNKARKFIEKALEINADLVLTPEYSFPFPILDEILNDPANWPQQGQLWCLGTQGENRNTLITKLQTWGSIPNVHLENIATEHLEARNFVSPLFYLFQTKNRKLCILPQYKTGSMADPRNAFEGPNLCRGTYVFVFGLDNGQSLNIFLSLICADAFHIQAQEIISKIHERYIILFHPQLNSEPRYDDLVVFRRNLYNTGQRETKIITLNWATSTYGDYSGENLSFNIPWSAYFKKLNPGKPLNDRNSRKNKENNHKKGTPFVISDYIEIWFSDREEHCKSFIISKGDNGSSLLPVTVKDDPITDDCYTYISNQWISNSSKCASNIKDIFDKFGEPLDFPYPICAQGQNQCDKCQKTDYFYGSLFGNFENHEILFHNEKVSRLLVSSDEHSDSLRREKFDMLMHLKRLLAGGVFPQALSYLRNNYFFKISDEFPDQGRDQYNIAPINRTHVDPEALVVITNEMDTTYIERLVDKLQKAISKKYRNQILVYYKVPGNGYRFYDKHLTQKSITTPIYSTKSTSIKDKFKRAINRGGI